MSIWKIMGDAFDEAMDVAEEYLEDKPYFDTISTWLQSSMADASEGIADYVSEADDDQVTKMGQMIMDSAYMNLDTNYRIKSIKFYVYFKLAETAKYQAFIEFQD